MTESATRCVSESLARAGLDPCPATPEGEIALCGPETQTAGHPAAHAVVVSLDTIRLLLADGECNALASVVLGPADALALASDLLNAARVRVGRPGVQ